MILDSAMRTKPSRRYSLNILFMMTSMYRLGHHTVHNVHHHPQVPGRLREKPGISHLVSDTSRLKSGDEYPGHLVSSATLAVEYGNYQQVSIRLSLGYNSVWYHGNAR
jgi:hypothetical protein